MTRLRTRALSAACVAVPVVLAGCSSSGSSPANSSPSKRPGAAEPASAPSNTAAPAGRVMAVGDKAEGIIYDPVSKLVAVAVRNPSRLLLLDGTTLAVRRSVPLPGVVRHLQLAGPGGPVLAPCESANALVEVPLRGDLTLRTTTVGKEPHDATAVDGGIRVVGDEFGPSLSVVRDGKLIRTITGPASGVEQPGSVIGDGPDVALVDVKAFTVSTFDPATGKRLGVIDAGAGPTHGVLANSGVLAVTDTRGNALLTYQLDPLKETAAIPLAGTPYGIAFDPVKDWVWITLTARNQVVAFDLTGSTPREVVRLPTDEQPNTITVAPGSATVWITGTRAGSVQQINR